MNEKIIWNYLYSKINNAYGVAALIGNLYAESNLNPINLQGTYEIKLDMSDAQYTEAVDCETYSNFVHDSAGYGLAQWTYWSRKEALLNYAKSKKVSIGNLYMQLEFILEELQQYKRCFNIIKNATSVKEASDVIVTDYEKPSNQSEKAKQNRANYGQKYYNMFVNQGDCPMISVSDFLSGVQKNVNRIHSYKLGNDGSNGTSDCIGLIIGAIRLSGGKWIGTHGSNYSARNAMSSLGYIANEKQMFVGEVVYKAKNPSDDGYALPSSYDDSQDRKDYYHVGVVTSIYPLCITHCTGVEGGIKKDSSQGKWKYGGKLKYVNYEEGGESRMEEPLYRAIVTAVSGNTVRMRSQPSTDSTILENIPIGTNIEVMDVLDGWSQIQYNGQIGYMMSEFLKQEDTAIPTKTTIDYAQLRQIQLCLLDALSVINKALGSN